MRHGSPNLNPTIQPEYKICSKCKQKKHNETEFYRRSKEAGGQREACCKTCKKEIYKRDRKWGHKKERYSISKNQFEKLLAEQNNACAICRVPVKNLNRMICIDHCHTSGKLRGLLCHNCNSGIGLLKDNIQILEQAIQYLRSFNEFTRV